MYNPESSSVVHYTSYATTQAEEDTMWECVAFMGLWSVNGCYSKRRKRDAAHTKNFTLHILHINITLNVFSKL